MNERIDAEIEKYEDRVKNLKTYLLMKFTEEDYHGVEDAASDIRDNLAAIEALRNIKS